MFRNEIQQMYHESYHSYAIFADQDHNFAECSVKSFLSVYYSADKKFVSNYWLVMNSWLASKTCIE